MSDVLLSRLDKVKRLGDGRWLARCPAHDDGSPSLSVRETDDGTVLVHCFAGCSAADVLAAVGLDLADLFPDRHEERGPLRRGERHIPRDVLAAVAYEARIVAIAAQDIAAGREVIAEDRERIQRAATRLQTAADEVRGHGG